MRVLFSSCLLLLACENDPHAVAQGRGTLPSRSAEAPESRASSTSESSAQRPRAAPEPVSPTVDAGPHAAALAVPTVPMTTIRAASDCPEGMLFVPAGTFTMGFTQAGLREYHQLKRWAPPRQVTLTKPYCMDKTEVTAGAYRQCVAAGACVRNHCNARWDDTVKHPMNCVNWTEANTYCTWAGKRLPTEAEWEFAARGPKSFRHPWGNSKPDDTKLWWSGTKVRGLHTAEVGSFPKGASPFGLLDMEGNVSEFVADWWAYPPTTPQIDPKGPLTGGEKVLKGGAMDWGQNKAFIPDMGQRYGESPSTVGSFGHGFRCAI